MPARYAHVLCVRGRFAPVYFPDHQPVYLEDDKDLHAVLLLCWLCARFSLIVAVLRFALTGDSGQGENRQTARAPCLDGRLGQAGLWGEP